GEEVKRRHAEEVAEEQCEDLLLELPGLAEKRRPECQQHHERERRGDVRPTSPTERADQERGEQREHAETNKGAHPDEVRPCGTSERAVRDRVGGECRASEHDTEADHARNNRDDRGDLPRIDHEAGEHGAYLTPALAATTRGALRVVPTARGPSRRRRNGRPVTR